jgi:hypothetical protein
MLFQKSKELLGFMKEPQKNWWVYRQLFDILKK